MRVFTSIAALAVAFCSTAIAAPSRHTRSSAQEIDLEVQTSSGKIIGLINGTTPNVRQFLNVPYAQPPLNNLRFRPPQALSQPRETIISTSLGPACPQIHGTSASIDNTVVTQLNFNGSTAEDCLNLAIWAPLHTPNKKTELLPVFIYLFGGGYTTGGIDVLYQIPAQWVERTQAHIVISLNTRVNIFGYPGSGALEFQNPGLLDQRMALEWAQENIAAFGGDPDRIVLWGQSSGAGSVDLLNFAYPEDPIASGFISDSGSVFLNNQKSDATFSNFSYVAEQVNCSSANYTIELECMQGVDYETIETVILDYEEAGNNPLKFVPFVDDISIFGNYTLRYELGALSDRPAIFGTNLREGYEAAPWPSDPETTAANATVADGYTDYAFLCPAMLTTGYRETLGLPTFRYQYRGNFSNISPYFWFGAFHGSELPLLFGTYGDYRGPPTAFENEVSYTMQDFWLAFARDGAKGVEALGWKSSANGDGVNILAEMKTRKASTMIPAKDVDTPCTQAVIDTILGGANPFAVVV
ncbi:uncharacterized protein N7503_009202 [Penicillium pulvis]|uniref:uncharacterized protein n=1 Tax=Penicillium pulvis TaxID=1562058 RepID=UPI002546A1CF|nr:uncharacterized protein N7503_009202 [Penicillium pulvis]KAJ5793224.1 hypothetical protein N7503_009202 [Penicillium pulvis]